MNMSAGCSKPLILAVDDNQDNLFLLEYQLPEVIDCFLLTATDGETALTLIAEKSPDLILMDLLLPGIDGVEVISRLKRSPDTSHIPMIALTGLSQEDANDRLNQSRCDDYLCKPYDLEDLQTIIHRHLKVHSLL
ncbi:two-component system response regulator [Phormidesmis sp. 146-12]